MKVKGFILYKTKEFVEAHLNIKDAEINEINFEYFKGLYPLEHSSTFSKITELKKTHEPNRIQNGCRYYIQHSIKGEVMNIYLDLNMINYYKLEWQIFNKKYLKTKDFVVGLILLLIGGLITFIISKN